MSHNARQQSRETQPPRSSDGPKHDSVKKGQGQESVYTTAGRIAMEGYEGESANGISSAAQIAYNPTNTKRPQSSKLLNINDPIQVHLLVETALDDSSEYAILAQEEVDSLKRQVNRLEQQIVQTRQNLAIQSKFRDAAVSMVKLYSPRSSATITKKTRTSILGSRRDSGSFGQADQERIMSEQRCHDLALELWHLEKTLMGVQRRLLHHTAGILQMTHKGPVKVDRTVGDDAIPGSPESMYAYNNGRINNDATGAFDIFDERSLYRAFDQFDGSSSRPGTTAGSIANGSFNEHLNTINMTEAKLEDLNKRLYEVIMKARLTGPKHIDSLASSKDAARISTSPGKGIVPQLKDLEIEIDTIDMGVREMLEEHKNLTQQHHYKDADLEATVKHMKQQIEALVPLIAPPPALTMNVFDNHNAYIKSNIPTIAAELRRMQSNQAELESLRQEHAAALDTATNSHRALERANSVNTKHASQVREFEVTLMGLWDIIQSEEQHNREVKLQNPEDAINDDLGDENRGDNNVTPVGEPFSLQTFSAKVQSTFFDVTRLEEQKKVLTRQIQQQREVNEKENANLVTKLAAHEKALADANNEKNFLHSELLTIKEQLEGHRREIADQHLTQSRSEDAEKALSASLQTSDSALKQLEMEFQAFKDEHQSHIIETDTHLTLARQQIANLTKQLEEAQASSTFAVETATTLKSRETEIEEMTMQIATLQTEVTIARAELDGAYGSRAQRAANVASNPAIQKEIDELTAKNQSLSASLTEYQDKATSAAAASSSSAERVQTLKKELEETIAEFEIMTKASIEWERERDRLEAEIDRLRDEKEGLASRLGDEQVRWLGMNTSINERGSTDVIAGGLRSPGFGATSTGVMKDEFKKMMRDARAEALKALKAEQGERRKVEDELRALKKTMIPVAAKFTI